MDPLSVAASTLALIGAISSTYKTIQHLRGLPKEFTEVYRALPITQNTLITARKQMQAEDLDDTTKAAIGEILITCKQKAEQLSEIFKDFERAGMSSQNSSVFRFYRTSLLRLGKSHQVDTLMKDIMRSLETLATNRAFKAASQKQVIELKEAIESLSKMETPLGLSELREAQLIRSQTIASEGLVSQDPYVGQDNRAISRSSTFRDDDIGVNVYFGCRPSNAMRINNVRMLGTLPLRHQRDVSGYTGSVESRKGPPIEHIPFRPVPAFTGREAILADIKTLLFENARERVALVGLGGIGKTQVALRLAWWVSENKRPYSVIWLPGHRRAGFEKACTDVLRKIGISYTNDEDPKEILRLYLSSQEAERWLLVLDNADDVDVLRGDSGPETGILPYLPRSSYGRILVTTRSQDVAVRVAGRDVKELREMNIEEGKLLLERSLIQRDQIDDEDLVRAFLEKLVYLPLAIAQAVAYININMDTDIKEYIELLGTTTEDAIELLSESIDDTAHLDKSQGAVATTWIVSFTKIREMSPLAAQLLSLIRWIEPNGIPKFMLPGQESRQALTKAIGVLRGYRFLNRQGEGEVYDMHSLVHFVLRIWTQREKVQDMSREATFRHLCTIFDTDDWGQRETWRAMLPHILRALELAEGVEDDDYCFLQYFAARCELTEGRVQRSLVLFKHLVAIREKLRPEDHPDRLASQHMLARAYQDNGQVNEAVALLEHVVAIREKTLTEDDLSRFASERSLAGAYLVNKQAKKAITLLEQVVAVSEKALAKNHFSRLISEHALAMAYRNDGQVDKAVVLLESVVAAQKEQLLEDSPFRLSAQHELALAYQANGQIQEAVALLEYVVKFRERSLAEDHPELLASQNMLAGAYEDNGQIAKAIILLEHVVAVRENVLSEDHPDRLRTQGILAETYWRNGQFEKADILWEHVAAIREQAASIQ